MIVAAYRSSLGTVYINDAAYRDATPEEIQRRQENLQRVAWDMAVDLELKGVVCKKPEGLPELQKLDMNDQAVIEEIQAYEKMMQERWKGREL